MSELLCCSAQMAVYFSLNSNPNYFCSSTSSFNRGAGSYSFLHTKHLCHSISENPRKQGIPAISYNLSKTTEIHQRNNATASEVPVSNAHKVLPHGLDARLLPKHVAIIMDGNSRWACNKGLVREAGHLAGVRALNEVVRLSCQWGIQVLTVFAFSTENWTRSKNEVSSLLQLFSRELRAQFSTLIKGNIRLRVIGDVKRLPLSLQSLIRDAEEETSSNTGLKLNVAFNYSGRCDIVQACQRIAEKVDQKKLKLEDITEAQFDKELWTGWIDEARNPDLLIRTSGEQRLSNFLLWQLAYTELFFMDVFWPDVGEAEYAHALRSYQRRNRRYGRRPEDVTA